MNQVRVDKGELLRILEKNARAHAEEYLVLERSYKAALKEFFEEQLEAIENGEEPVLYCNLPQPTDHTEDYDRAIQMLQMSLDGDVNLNASEFRTYIQDEWGWKNEHLATSTFYAAGR